FVHRNANQFLRILVELAMFLEVTGSHSRVAIYFRISAKSLLLKLPRAEDAFANRGRIFLSALTSDIAIFNCRHFDVQINTIQQRAGDALPIPLHLQRPTTAFALQVAKIAARTRVYRGNKHELRGKRYTARRPRHSDLPVLKRLPHHLQSRSLKLG